MTRFLALLIGLSVTATAAPAIADSMPYPGVYCREAQMDDPNEIAKKMTRASRERIAGGFEVIIDGVIESYQPEAQSGGKYLPGLVIMRVDKIWKGDVTPRVDLAECAFRYSSFRNASFRGTDLTGSYFQDSDLAGAQYDCATKLPNDLDPALAGMINVEGQCAKP